VLGIAGLLLALPTASEAAYPGGNGKIAFERGGQIWSMNPDGTGAVQLTTDAARSSEPEWSPNGKQIAYTRGAEGSREVHVMNADGTGDRMFAGGYDPYSPTWSPDGSSLAYVYSAFEGGYQGCNCTRWYIHARELSGNPITYAGFETVPVSDIEWSSKGLEFLFTKGSEGVDRQFVAAGGEVIAGDACCDEAFGGGPSPDAERVAWAQSDLGSSSATLYTRTRSGGSPQPAGPVGEKVDWSPDGMRLVFDVGGDIYTSNPDGTGRTQITATPETEQAADWQPVMDTVYPGYARPKEASVLRVPLVPSYKRCGSPNSQHGPPLAFASCNPPVQASSYLTVGTPDANGAPAESVGFVQFKVRPGDPATLANEADLTIDVAVNDVHCRIEDRPIDCQPPASPAGEAYAAWLEADIQLRVTDRFNLPSQNGRAPGTTSNSMFLRFSPYCGANQNYGTCTMHTTVNALGGQVLREGRRTVWEFDAIRLWDDPLPASRPRAGVFLTQGVFVP
jgi:hypothetical protein